MSKEISLDDIKKFWPEKDRKLMVIQTILDISI